MFEDLKRSTLCVLSGGLDSTILTAISTKISPRVEAITFHYQQKQRYEIDLAIETAKKFKIKHTLIDISFLGELAKNVSANITGSDIPVPNIKDVLGHPQPVTYVPNRNAILLNIAASYAEANNLENVATGLQTHDSYGYFDTTPEFVRSIDDTWRQNRMHRVRLIAPFIHLSKLDELKVLHDYFDAEEAENILRHTMTCYNPDGGVSCGRCPSCSERIQAFLSFGISDPIRYSGGPFACVG